MFLLSLTLLRVLVSNDQAKNYSLQFRSGGVGESQFLMEALAGRWQSLCIWSRKTNTLPVKGLGDWTWKYERCFKGKMSCFRGVLNVFSGQMGV